MARTPPVFVSVANTDFSATTSSKSLNVAVQTGDLIVVGMLSADHRTNLNVSASGHSFTTHQNIYNQSSYSQAVVRTTVATSSTTLTINGDNDGDTSWRWGMEVQVWRSHGGFGASSQTRGSGSSSSQTFSTAVDNSAIAVFIADWNAVDGSSRTRRTVNGSTGTETLYGRDSGAYTRYASYYSDAGTAGSKTVGWSSPSGQKFSAVSIEILGSTSTVNAIPSQEAWGTPAISYGPATISPTGIASAEAWGNPTLKTSALHPVAIDSEEAWGTPTAAVDTWRQIIERDWFIEAVEAHTRTISYRVVMIDSKDIQVGEDVPVTDGNIQHDGDSAEQWSLSATIVGEDWVPEQPTDPLDPRAGLRCRVFWRILINRSWVEIPCGTFFLENPKIKDDGVTPVITIDGRDPISILRETGYGREVIAVGGLTVPDALTRIFTRLIPGAPVKLETTSGVTLPAVYELSGDDPLADATDIAAQAGLIIYSDREGAIVCAPKPEPETIKANWQEGEDCPVIGIDRGIGTSGILNSVTVVSTNPEIDPPISVTVEDDDPSSPTWVEGPFRRRSTTIRSDSVATEEGAESFARAVLNSRRRPTENVTVEVPGRGDLGYMDQVLLKSDNAKIAGAYRIARWTLPITGADQAPPTMTVTMTERTLI